MCKAGRVYVQGPLCAFVQYRFDYFVVVGAEAKELEPGLIGRVILSFELKVESRRFVRLVENIDLFLDLGRSNMALVCTLHRPTMSGENNADDRWWPDRMIARTFPSWMTCQYTGMVNVFPVRIKSD